MRARSGSVAFFAILLLCLTATLLSVFPTFTYQLPGRCSFGFAEAGYPFPWYTQPFSSQGIACCGPTGHCTLFHFYNPNIPLRTFYFLVDTAFYGTMAIGIMTASKATIIVSRKLKAGGP